MNELTTDQKADFDPIFRIHSALRTPQSAIRNPHVLFVMTAGQ
jgi:hypothetical protein